LELAGSSSDVNWFGAGGGEEAESGERMEIREGGKGYGF